MRSNVANAAVVFETKSGPGFLVRAVWFLFVGWWLTGIMSVIAWLSMITIIGLPIGIYLINRIPTFITLRPRTRQITATMEAGLLRISEHKRSQQPWYIRLVWFIFIGSWMSAIAMLAAWVLCVLILTLPLGLMLYNRIPFVASLYRY
jgi:uncharacterized membrane protein YccF (DUF307 family)